MAGRLIFENISKSISDLINFWSANKWRSVKKGINISIDNEICLLCIY